MRTSLTLGEKKWHGCVYHTAKPYLTSWDLTINNTTWNKISQWCYDTYGKPGDPWSDETERWYLNNSTYWFREKSDLAFFILKWS